VKALAIVVCWLAACDFQPAPPAAPSVVEKPTAASIDAAVTTVEDAGIPRPDATVIAVTDACMQTATHIADVLIASQTDESLKSSYETARDRIVRATAEACTTQNWTPDAQKCFAQAKLEADLHACEKKFPTKT
jgi:hypothetical protein